jgi:hypothetical protein
VVLAFFAAKENPSKEFKLKGGEWMGDRDPFYVAAICDTRANHNMRARFGSKPLAYNDLGATVNNFLKNAGYFLAMVL